MKLLGQELNPYELEQIKIGGDFRKPRLVVGAIDGLLTAGLVSAAFMVSESQIAIVGSFLVLAISLIFLLFVWRSQRTILSGAQPLVASIYLIKSNPALDWPFGPKARWWALWDVSRYALMMYAFGIAGWTSSVILVSAAYLLNLLVLGDKARLTIRALSIDSYHAPLGPIDQDDL